MPMNITTETSSPPPWSPAAPPDSLAFSDVPAPPDSPTESWLIAWALSRNGFPTVISLNGQTAAAPRFVADPPQFALHLKHALPLPELLRALVALRGSGGGGKRRPSA